MNEDANETWTPEECSQKILELSGLQSEPAAAVDLWSKIVKHKWLLSKILGREAGLRTSFIDFFKIHDRPL